MGNRLADRVAEQVPLAEGPAQAYVQRVGEEIVAETDLHGRPWSFHVVASDQVNAFALPGGHVYVNAGLVEAAATPSELAGVIAHEVAHGAARHGTERLTEAYGIDTLIGLVTDGETGLMQDLLTRLGRRGAIATFSRDDEREADRLGMAYLQAAGYDARGMVCFFETLLEQRQRRPNALEQFFATHPLTEDRLQAARTQLEEQAVAGSNRGPAPAANAQRFRQAKRHATQLAQQ